MTFASEKAGDDVVLLQVGADDMRQQVLREGLLGDVPGEVIAAEADVEEDTAALGIPHRGKTLPSSSRTRPGL